MFGYCFFRWAYFSSPNLLANSSTWSVSLRTRFFLIFNFNYFQLSLHPIYVLYYCAMQVPIPKMSVIQGFLFQILLLPHLLNNKRRWWYLRLVTDGKLLHAPINVWARNKRERLLNHPEKPGSDSWLMIGLHLILMDQRSTNFFLDQRWEWIGRAYSSPQTSYNSSVHPKELECHPL